MQHSNKSPHTLGMWVGSIYRESRPIDGSPNALYGSFTQPSKHHQSKKTSQSINHPVSQLSTNCKCTDQTEQTVYLR